MTIDFTRPLPPPVVPASAGADPSAATRTAPDLSGPPLKAVLAHADWMRNELRAPMTAASAALEQRLQTLLGLSPR